MISIPIWVLGILCGLVIGGVILFIWLIRFLLKLGDFW